MITIECKPHRSIHSRSFVHGLTLADLREDPVLIEAFGLRRHYIAEVKGHPLCAPCDNIRLKDGDHVCFRS